MKVNQIITEKILESLKNGVIPWRKPWNMLELMNGFSKKGYRGINPFILAASSKDNYFFTFRQVKELGGTIRKGAKQIPIVFYTFLKKEENGTEKSIPFMRYYGVFGLSDIEGMKWKAPEVKVLDFKPIDKMEAFVAAQNASISFGGNRACCDQQGNITLPRKEQFKSVEEYYSTLCHELGHREGFKTFGLTCDSFGSDTYASEELVAELTASFLLGYCGIDASATFENSVSYIQGWMKKISDDAQLVITAASKAQKRFDVMLKRFDPSYVVFGQENS